MRIWLLILVFLSGTAFAQSSTRFTIARGVIAGGGATFSSSAQFQLVSTIAQPLAAVPASAQFSIQGGFWILAVTGVFRARQERGQFHRLFPDQSGEHLHRAIHGHVDAAELAKPAGRSGQRRGGSRDEFRARHRAQILPAHRAVTVRWKWNYNRTGPPGVPRPICRNSFPPKKLQ